MVANVDSHPSHLPNQQRTHFGRPENIVLRALAISLAVCLSTQSHANAISCKASLSFCQPLLPTSSPLSLSLAPSFLPAANLSERQTTRRPGNSSLAPSRLPRIPTSHIYIPRHYLSSILHFCSFLDTPPTPPKPARADAALIRRFPLSHPLLFAHYDPNLYIPPLIGLASFPNFHCPSNECLFPPKGLYDTYAGFTPSHVYWPSYLYLYIPQNVV